MKIKELPLNERPREKARRYGIESLSDTELLALLIGNGGVNNSCIDIAHNVLLTNKGLVGLFQMPYEQSLAFKGIGPENALRLTACFELGKRYWLKKADEGLNITNANYLFKKYLPKIIETENEIFIIVIVNQIRKITYEQVMYQGTSNSVAFATNEVIKEVLLHNGKYFYIIHNHPDGDFYPSNADNMLTKELLRQASKMRIKMLDHLIFSQTGFYSFLKNEGFDISKIT